MNTTNVPSVTMQTAVMMQVKEFVNNNQSFSIHDITKAIRNKTETGELTIPEVEVSGASFRFDIPHTKVKATFEELCRTSAFDSEFTLNRKFLGMYFLYTAIPVQNISTAQTTTPTMQSYTAPSYISKDNTNRVQLYLDNCAKKNFRPTLKQIQSAIKRDCVPGCSCEELKSYITTLGYNIVDDPEALSKSQVIV